MKQPFAVVITYHPNTKQLDNLITKLLDDCHKVIIVDNGNEEPLLERDILKFQQCIYIKQSTNAGVGNAQNVGILRAINLGASHIILFDQDSLPEKEMIYNLQLAMLKLESNGNNVAAVGPIHENTTKNRENKPLYTETNHLISSGTLISVKRLVKIGLMCEDFFIDGIDIEWCFRSLSKGFSLFKIKSAVMTHRLGQTKSILKRYKMTYHQPFRYYYMFRNYMKLLKLSYVPLRAKLSLVKLLLKQPVKVLFLRNKKEYLVNMMKGFIHGFFFTVKIPSNINVTRNKP